MPVSSRGLALIRRFEGLRLAAYDDGVGVQTIGYGHTRGVKPGDTCTPEQAEQWLADDAAEAEAAVLRGVRVPLTQAQLDALVSFVFNVGAGAFRSSTLLRKLNAGDTAGAAAEFARWNKGGGRVLTGLVTRRAAEREMFLSESPAAVLAPRPPEAVTTEPNMSPFLIPAVQAVVEAAPALIRIFGSGSEISERNAKAAELVVQAAKDATGSRNEQELVEALQSDPQAVASVQQAVAALPWGDLVEVGGGIEGARKADAQFVATKTKPLKSPAFIVSLILLIFPAMLLVDLFYVHPDAYANELRTQIVTGILMVIGMVGAYWLGSSFGSQRKDELGVRQ